MDQQSYHFWTCPGCRHARALNRDQMTNRCLRIDQGESLVDGAAWEFQDHDVCPAFEPRADRPVADATASDLFYP